MPKKNVYPHAKELLEKAEDVRVLLGTIDLSIYRDYPSVGLLAEVVRVHMDRFGVLQKKFARIAARIDAGAALTKEHLRDAAALEVEGTRLIQFQAAMMREMKHARRTEEAKDRRGPPKKRGRPRRPLATAGPTGRRARSRRP